MSKALKTAAIVVGAVALIATGVGAAAGAGLITLSASAAATVATIGTIAGVAASVLSLAAGLTAKKPTAADATGSQTSFSADPDAGIPLALGRTGTAGNIVLRKGFDTNDAGDNDRQAFVSVLSLGPVKSVGGFTADRSPVAFNGSGQATGSFAGYMWQKVQLGLLASAALTFGTGAGSPPGYSGQLSGKAAATLMLRFDTKAKLYQNGVPAPMWVVEGGFCYDPRKDTTYPGGSGPHRLVDPSDRAAYDAAVATWEYSECPYLNALKWAHGHWQRDTSNPTSDWQRVMGMGAPKAAIDFAPFVEGANIADANGWKVGGVIYSGDDKWDSFKKILQSGMGEPLTLGAKVSCLVNAPRVSLATITIDDVVGAASVTATQRRRARINTITPRYRLEANNWALLPGPPIGVPEHIIEDRGKRSKVQDYPLIQQAKQVATAVRYDIENAREFGPIVLPLKLVWLGYKPGDCVTATLPELGLNAQPILLLNRQLEPAGGVVTVTARSETDAKHAYALGQTTTPPSTPALSGPPLVPVPGVLAWDIVATELTKDDAVTPALVIGGSADAATAEAIIVEYRPWVSGQAPGDNWRAAGIFTTDTERVEIASVAQGTAYEVAVSYRVRGVVGGRRILGPEATSTAVAVGPDGTPLINLIEAVKDITSGKSTVFWATTPPLADTSKEHDIWFDTANGNYQYRRIAGSGRLAFGSNRLSFGGNGLIVAPWAPAPDQRIAQALSDAAAAILQAQTAQATADEATDRLSELDDDGLLTPFEKTSVLIPKAAQLEGSWGALDAQATTFGITTERAAAAAARAAWLAVLAGISPAWNDDSATSPVDRTTYQATLDDHDAKLAALQKAISDEAGKRAQYSLITGTKPPTDADNTSQNQITVSLIQAIEIPASYTGTIAGGTLPKYLSPLVKRGGADVTTDNATTYALSNYSGGNDAGNTVVDNTNGSVTKGRVAIGAGWNATGSADLTISYSGVAVGTYTLRITKLIAGAPAGSGSGSSGYTKAGNFDISGQEIASTTLIEVGRISNMSKATGETIRAYFNGTYTTNAAANASRNLSAKWQYSPAGTNTWTDFGSAVAGSNAVFLVGYGTSTTGSVTCNQTATPSDGNYDLRLMVAINSNASTSSLVMESGAASAEIKV